MAERFTIPSPPDFVLIRASELAQFEFCRRAWWLGTVKQLPAESQTRLRRGRRHHQRHNRQVQLGLIWHRMGLALLLAGGLFLVAALLWLWLF